MVFEVLWTVYRLQLGTNGIGISPISKSWSVLTTNVYFHVVAVYVSGAEGICNVVLVWLCDSDGEAAQDIDISQDFHVSHP